MLLLASASVKKGRSRLRESVFYGGLWLYFALDAKRVLLVGFVGSERYCFLEWPNALRVVAYLNGSGLTRKDRLLRGSSVRCNRKNLWRA